MRDVWGEAADEIEHLTAERDLYRFTWQASEEDDVCLDPHSIFDEANWESIPTYCELPTHDDTVRHSDGGSRW